MEPVESVGIRELKQRTSEIVRLVQDSGRGVDITCRGKVVARIVPNDAVEAAEDRSGKHGIDSTSWPSRSRQFGQRECPPSRLYANNGANSDGCGRQRLGGLLHHLRRTPPAQSRLAESTVHRARSNAVLPSLVLAEVGGAVSRRAGDATLARAVVHEMLTIPELEVVPIDELLGLQAAHLAVDLRLRGVDACYVAVARKLEVPLATWDDELCERAAGAVQVLRPQ